MAPCRTTCALCSAPMPRSPVASPELLQDPLLQAIAVRGGVHTSPAHAVLVTEDDRSDALFIVLRGRIKAHGSDPDGRDVTHSTQGPGEYFGEMTPDTGSRSASVVTLEPTEAVGGRRGHASATAEAHTTRHCRAHWLVSRDGQPCLQAPARRRLCGNARRPHRAVEKAPGRFVSMRRLPLAVR